jgi:TolB protein
MLRSEASKGVWVDKPTAFYVMVLGVLAALVLVAAGTSPAEAAFPGKNGKIAFVSDRDGNEEIYTMNQDGTSQQNLTASTAAADGNPSWSPNGKQVVFDSNRDGNNEIYRMGAAGTLQTRLTRNSAVDFSPVYSPDGKKIAFVSDRDGYSEIYTMSAGGGSQVRLTYNSAGDYRPSWQPLP